MSAFIVSSETMQRIVNAIAREYPQSWAGMPTYNSACLDKLGTTLFNMNARAVARRYGDEIVEEGIPFAYRPMAQVDEVTAYRAISCLLYQCSEGDVSDGTYQALRQLQARIANRFMDRVATERKLPWDWPEP